MGLTKNFFGAELLSKAEATISSQAAQMAAQGTSVPKEQIAAAISQAKDQVAPFQVGSLSVAHLALGFLVMALVTSLGGPTGPGLNPARDLGPRILHFILPESILGKHKGDSNGGILGFQLWHRFLQVSQQSSCLKQSTDKQYKIRVGGFPPALFEVEKVKMEMQVSNFIGSVAAGPYSLVLALVFGLIIIVNGFRFTKLAFDFISLYLTVVGR